MRFKHLLSGILWGERRYSPLPTLMTSVGVQYPVRSLLCLPAEPPACLTIFIKTAFKVNKKNTLVTQ
jgi:hypothetical protein